jgi:hypothetical protein
MQSHLSLPDCLLPSTRLSRCIAVCLMLLLGVMAAAQAQHRQGHPHPGAPAWRGDIRHFHDHDWGVWRDGRWFHGRHGGHLGWWWVIGSSWYFYPAPVYPYPDPYLPPAAIAPPAEPPPAQYWYYCESARAYYPYVPSCVGGWTRVPATPDAAGPVPPP